MNTTHYPSLELCKKLTEIGFPETELLTWEMDATIKIGEFSETDNDFCSPSVMEMLDVIPKELRTKNQGIHPIKFELHNEESYWSHTNRAGEKGLWFLTIGFNGSFSLNTSLGTLPNALADMILWLHENNHISFTK